MTLELQIREAHSLKEKRHVVKSLKDRLRHRFNVSVAEVDYQDLHQSALIAVAVVSPSKQVAASILESVEKHASDQVGPMLVDVQVEWF
jgi:uncharacterized protein